MKNSESNEISPPYISWETLKTFLKTLKQSAVPNRIDSSIMLPTMSGSTKAGVTTALKFFSLIDLDGQTKDSLKDAVDAIETDKWPETIKKVFIPAYGDIVQDLKLNSATRKELDEKFGDVSQPMRDKFIRFYIPMLQEAGETVSPFLTQAQRGGPRKTKRKQAEGTTGYKGPPAASNTPEDMFDQFIPITGTKDECFIRVPRNITPKQVELVKAAVTVIEVMAKQNEESKE